MPFTHNSLRSPTHWHRPQLNGHSYYGHPCFCHPDVMGAKFLADSQPSPVRSVPNYYEILEVPPQAPGQRLRQAHRDLSKLYHPDTTRFPADIARRKFEQIQTAYEVLSDPAQRLQYDLRLGLVTPPKPMVQPPPPRPPVESSAYLSAEDRPLSSGELFALFLFGVTFLGCLMLAIILGLLRGEDWMPTPSWQTAVSPPIELVLAWVLG